MAEFVLKYADARGEMRQQTAEAASEQELRERYSQQGYLVYSIKQKGQLAGLGGSIGKSKLNLEKFLIFNQQFVTLIRAGLPILKSLDLLADRLTDPKLGKHIQQVRDEVRNGALLSDAFAAQPIFPPIYVTSVLAGEKSGALAEVLDRFITYQKTALAIRKKIIVSLMYPCLLLVMVIALIIFLITYVVPNFAQLYNTMGTNLPQITRILIAVGTTAKNYVLGGAALVAVAIAGLFYWSRQDSAQIPLDRIKLKTPVFGNIWVKYQVAQFSRILGTLLVGGIPLVQALDTAADSLGSKLLKVTLSSVKKTVREGQPLSSSLRSTGIFPDLSMDMIEVGESTGALSAMLNSVAEFYEDDVNTRMQAVMSLIEPAIMLAMGAFVAFVLVALYLPIFSLTESLGG